MNKEFYGLNINFMSDGEQWFLFNVFYIEFFFIKKGIRRLLKNRRREDGEKGKGKRLFTV